MLEFSDAPYQFFESKPSPPFIWMARQANRLAILPGRNHRIAELRIEGETDATHEARASGDRLIFVINHPSHSDPQVVTEVHRRLGVPSCFMAAYDVFLRNRVMGWCMQRFGNFSIDREGSDRKAMAEAIRTIEKGRHALNIFPEGNVYLTNDRVAPFLDGAAFIALKAQKSVSPARVKIIPVSLKFTHLNTPREAVTERLAQLGRDSGHTYEPGVQPMEAVLGLGRHLVADHIRRIRGDQAMDFDSGDLFESIRAFTDELVTEVESALALERHEDVSLIDRIRGARSKIHQLRTAPESDSNPGAGGAPEIEHLADKAILALRTHGYLEPYLTRHPTVDRYDETVERIAEDHYSMAMPRTGPRRAIARIHAPLDAGEFLDRAEGKLRNAVADLTRTLEDAVQAGIDAINEKNDAPGARPVDDVAHS